MKYSIYDKFMLRTPNITYNYLEKYRREDKDIYEFISSDKYLDKTFKRALLISSKSLYNAYINKPTDKKKYINLCDGLLKYFIRMTTRPTPFGYMANVSLGSFDNVDFFIKDSEIIDIKPDNEWVNGFIKNLERNKKYIKLLYFKKNDICFKSGDRYKNPYFTNAGNVDDGENIIRENSVRYTDLISLVLDNTKRFISYKNLFTIIKNNYKDVDENLIEKTIFNLLKNEYLFSNLRVSAYTYDIFEKLLNEIDGIEEFLNLKKIINELRLLFNRYKDSENLEDLKEIFKIMESLYKTRNYIELNIGYKHKKNNLSYEVKEKIEDFIEKIVCITPETEMYGLLSNFKSRFQEKYGNNIEVDLVEIIDENGFNGLEYLGNIYSLTEREKQITEVIKNKISKAIFGNENVYLYENDFENTEDYSGALVNSFDINIFISKYKGKYTYTIGPNVGASKAGSMFQRFSNCFEKDEIDSYNNIYDKLKDLAADEYIEAELREFTISGRSNNVVNNTKNYEYYLPIGFLEDENGSLTIDDLKIGLTYDDKLYIKSKKLNKRICFVKDNMLNTKLNSRIYQFLYEISNSTRDVPINRIYTLKNDDIYTPRIYYEGIIVGLKTWKLCKNELDNSSFDNFKRDFYRVKDIYEIDNLIYLVENDNRLLLNINRDEELRLLYKDFCKKLRIELSEVEPGMLNNSLIKYSEEPYINEFVFSLYLNEKDIDINSKYINGPTELVVDNREFMPFKNGWIYLKLYGLENRTNEFLTRRLDIVKELNCEKWFFIRYSDEIGNHIRLRFKFNNEIEAIENMKNINLWIKDLSRDKLVNRVVIDTYEREINRYGGKKLIDLFEKFSQVSSDIAIDILNNKDKYTIEDTYFIITAYIYMAFFKDWKVLFNIIDNGEYKNLFRKEYKRNRKKYIRFLENIKNREENEYYEIIEDIYKLKDVLNSIKKELEILYNKTQIIGSLAHMSCNRLAINRDLEYKTIVLFRHTIYDVLNKNRVLRKECKN